MSAAGKALFNAGVSATTGEFSGNVNVNTGDLFVDTSNSRVGIGTVSPAKTLHIVSATTDDTVLITTDENSSTAAPVLGFKRNSASPADSDYLGQIKFKGENDADQEITYSKITGKILDASDGTEDGIIEFANIKAGAQTVTARLRSNELQLLNDTGLSVAGDATITGNLTVNGTTTTLATTNSVISDTLIELANGTSGTPANDAGLVIERGSADNAFIGFDESEDKFTLGTGSFTGASTGNLTLTTGTLVANIEATTATLGGSDILSTDNTKTVTNKTLTLGNNTISGTLAQFQTAVTDATLVDLDDSQTLTNKTLTSPVLNTGVSGSAILDEDDFASDSATQLATQQSIKAYIATQITAQDLDFQGDSGGALSIDLDSETLTIAGGTGIDTSGSSNTLTVAIDSTVATLTGTQTLTNKTINLANNTVTGTLAQFNSALSDGSFASLAGSETLTNKTLTSPAIDTITRTGDFTVDASGDIILDADGADIIFKDAGTEIGRVTSSSFGLKAPGTDSIVFKGNDGESDITAMSIDFSSSGDISLVGDLLFNTNKGVYFGNSANQSITSNDTNLTVSTTGDIVLDSDTDIVLDADGADVIFKDGGTEFGRISKGASSDNLIIKSAISDKDLQFKGNDGGSEITALTLDMSDAGKATFNNNVTAASFTGASGATITGFADEDDMASNSATLGVTQQSIKAYVDSQLTAQDLDFRTGSAGTGSVDLDSEVLTFTGGTGINTTHSGQTITFAIDGTVATDNNSLTLANKTLTLPTIDEIDAVADFTVDAVGDINLDADGGDIIFKDDGTEFGRITNDSTDLIMKSAVSDKDFKIKGNDGGSEITAVTFDMSEAGAATFNAGITATTGTFSGAISGTQLSINENIIFEGATANDFETTLTVTDPTADRTLTLPDETGTVATRGFAVAMAIAL